MNRTIYRYPLKIESKQVIILRKGYKILHVGVQKGKPFIWALVPEFIEGVEGEALTILTKGTGHPISEKEFNTTNYWGTYVLEEEDFVGHVFQKI